MSKNVAISKRPLVTIDSMTSKQISELTGKEHNKVLRDIRNMMDTLSSRDCPKMDDTDYKGFFITYDERGYYKEVSLDKAHTFTLITGYSVELRKTVIDRWLELEEQAKRWNFETLDKREQLECMAKLCEYLPEDAKSENIDYIIANMMVNKITSLAFNLEKSLKKGDMPDEMLATRQNVLKDYVDFFGRGFSHDKIKDVLKTIYIS